MSAQCEVLFGSFGSINGAPAPDSPNSHEDPISWEALFDFIKPDGMSNTTDELRVSKENVVESTMSDMSMPRSNQRSDRNTFLLHEPATPSMRKFLDASPLAPHVKPPMPQLLQAFYKDSIEEVRAIVNSDSTKSVINELFWDHDLEPPLCAAVRLGCGIEIIQLLLDGGADVTSVDKYGRTALRIVRGDEENSVMLHRDLLHPLSLAPLSDDWQIGWPTLDKSGVGHRLDTEILDEMPTTWIQNASDWENEVTSLLEASLK